MDTGKIEERAIKIIEDIISSHDTMESRIKRSDKNMTWDGSIIIYKPDASIRSKATMDYEIPVQIKGHNITGKENYNRKSIQHSVDIQDLRLYYENTGCVYFHVFISNNIGSIFYNLLYPSKAKSFLDRAYKKKNSKSISIPFLRLENNPKALYYILKQFSIESIKQGSGRGQIVSRMINKNDIANITQLSFTSVDSENDFDIMKKLFSGDICLYGRLGDNDIEYPVEWLDHKQFYQKQINQQVLIDGHCFYDSFTLQMSSDDEWVIFLSQNLKIEYPYGKIFFKPVTDINTICVDADFLLAMNNSRSISFNNGSRVECTSVVLSEKFIKSLKAFKLLSEVFQHLGITFTVPLSSLTDSDLKTLQDIISLREGIINNQLTEQYNIISCKLCGKFYPILVIRHENDKRNDIFNAAYANDLRAYTDFENGKKYTIPLIYSLDSNVFANIYSYDYDSLVQQFEYSDINAQTINIINTSALKLVTAYDNTGDSKLLKIALQVFDRLHQFDMSNHLLVINQFQIKKRLSGLDAKDLDELKQIVSDNAEIQFGVAVLLENEKNASLLYQSLDDKQLNYINNLPIMTLYRLLQNKP